MKFIVEYDKNNKDSFQNFCLAYVSQLKEFMQIDEGTETIAYSLDLPVFSKSKSKERHTIKEVKDVKDLTNEERGFEDIWNLENLHS